MLWRKHLAHTLPTLTSLGVVVLSLLAALQTAQVVATSISPATDPPRHSTNLTDSVQWDNYTLWLNGQRFFLHSGEFHTFRLPVPDLWLDIFQKMAAAGLTGVSVYVHWYISNPAPGTLDFDHWRDLQPMFDAAKQTGLFVVLRPGPYINAETTAGGLALWVTTLTSGELRSGAPDWRASWQQYVHGIINQTAPNQISNNGPVIAVQIDNEFGQNAESGEYFAELEATYRTNGIVVPLTFNDPGEHENFVNGTGAVDIYGVDAYPNEFDCSHPLQWNPVPTNFHQYHEQVNPSQPWYIPEFQGGSLSGWGGPGYDQCFILTGPDFQDVFYKNNWASNAKLLSYYMLYGGTNWGGIAYPGVTTSYDYGASIRESRALSTKYDELKRQGLFLRSSPEFRKTDWIGDSTNGIPGVSVNNSAAFVTFLQNRDTGAGFYILRHANSTLTDTISFRLNARTSRGPLELPQHPGDGITLDGRQSKVIVTDFSFGKSSKVLYSTASILFAGRIGSQDVIFFHNDLDTSSEIAFGEDTIRVAPNNLSPGFHVLSTPNKKTPSLVLFSDPQTAAAFWAPVLPSARELGSYWQFGSNETVLVGGPNLVRNATISPPGHLALRGDLNTSTTLTLIVPESVTSVSWNGEKVEVRPVPSVRGMLQGRLEIKHNVRQIKVPQLANWKFKDSLPEVQRSFDDSHWVVADHTTTNITRPLFGDGRILYGCDYGFCENVVLWRGHFHGTHSTTSVNLTVNGGTGFAASVWLNNRFLGTLFNGTRSDDANGLLEFPHGAVKVGQDNVITVVQDHMGNDENPDERSPRGISGFKLTGGNFTTWKVQGKLGGYTNYPDKTRGVLNEGGLFGEREGWHLPGFDTSHWERRSLSEGIPNGAGIGFFVTTFDLDVPRGVDAMMSFEFDNSTQPYRALLFVNGWQFGKRVANIGPQFKFPVPPGILANNGRNTVAVALWALANTKVVPDLRLVLDGWVEGGVGPIATNNPAWSPRKIKA